MVTGVLPFPAWFRRLPIAPWTPEDRTLFSHPPHGSPPQERSHLSHFSEGEVRMSVPHHHT
ncbi:hypothetical protein ABWJ92_38655, partial [Streptomyces sp. NPDC000609]